MDTIRVRVSIGAVAAIFIAAACGGSAGSPAPGTPGMTPGNGTPGATLAPADTPTPQTPDNGLSADLTGAGASFPSPIYLEWIGAFQSENPGVRIDYRSIGSSGGREQFIAQQVDFGGSDAFMNDEAIAEATTARGCEPLHIPTVFGGVAIAYNVQGLAELTLDGETIAQIALGNITNINDPAIAALNEGVDLPDQQLTWVHRSDGSGTTSIFTGYLANVSQEWADQVGSGSEVEWPTGIGGDQNDGVAAVIQQQPGGIGYVSYEFVAEAGIPVAAVVNADGNAVSPSSESVSTAADTVDVPEDFRFRILGVGGDGYPIAGATWILAWTCGYDANVAEALQGWLRWSLEDGDDLAVELNYAPLSDELKQRVLDHIERINEEG
jgi:phosphate transport system substrate-binding protein